jgi:hypothetical protein
MGSDLYVSIDVRHPNDPNWNPDYWAQLFEGPSHALARGPVVDAFGDCDPDSDVGPSAPGHLTAAEWETMATHPECPWLHDDPYWVRKLGGLEFVSIIREKRWQHLQDGDFRDLECGPELRSCAALVESLLCESPLLDVRVWCWHSQ